MSRLNGKVIAVTGAGQGMGRSFAQAFAREGAFVGVFDLNEGTASATAQSIVEAGGKAMSARVDVTNRADWAAGLEAFAQAAGPLNVLVNNAGMNVPMHLLDVTEANWAAVMDVNALGTLLGIQEGAKRMMNSGGGTIINMSSIAGRQGYPSFAPYCASKFAVNALTQAAARGLVEHNITCNAIAPGVVDTPLWEQLDKDLVAIGDAEKPGQAMSDFTAGIIRGRAATPEDLDGLAIFLASDEASYLTGQVFMADGGMVLV